jgi:membrane-associated phospholipid phosphatase
VHPVAPHPEGERRAFRRINRLDLPYPVLWPFQQLGTPWLLPGTAVVAALSGRRRLAVAAGLGLPVEKAVEIAVKKAVPVPRPARLMATIRRGDAPASGESFPSGHAALAAVWVTVVSAEVPAWVTALAGAGAAVCAVTRVHQGAHHPSDAVGGAVLGLAIGGLLRPLATSR